MKSLLIKKGLAVETSPDLICNSPKYFSLVHVIYILLLSNQNLFLFNIQPSLW